MVLADEVLSVDPRMVLVVELGTILAFAEEYLPATWMYFGVFCDVVDYSFVNCPAVVFGAVLSNLIERIVCLARVLGQCLALLGLFDESLQDNKDGNTER